MKIFRLNKKKIIIYFILSVIFFSGILFERFKINKKIIDFFLVFSSKVINVFYTPNLEKNLILNLKEHDYNLILDIRKKALKEKVLTEDLEEWVSGTIITKNKNHSVKVRLKGVFSDHWDDSSQLSLKIKVSNDSTPIFGYKRFALQSPKTVSYIYEWLFTKALQKEKLLHLNIDFINYTINESNLGVYTLIEQIDKNFLIRNNRKNGPVIGFNKSLYLNEFIQSTELEKKGVILPINNNEDSFWRASIEPVQFIDDDENENENDLNLKDLKRAIFLLDSFRKGLLKPTEVFDTSKLAKIMALRALAGASEFDWRDTAFYYDKDRDLLEIISKEIHVDLEYDYRTSFYTWWIDSSKPRSYYSQDTDFFLDLLYRDLDFYERYLNELNNFSKNNYYLNLIKENKKEFNRFKKILELKYLKKKIFSYEYFEITEARVKDFIDPVQGINSYFKNYNNGILNLNISNLQRLPIQIIGLKLENNKEIILDNPILIKGQKPNVAVLDHEIKIDCGFLEFCSVNKIKKQKIIFRLLGQEKINLSDIIQYYY